MPVKVKLHITGETVLNQTTKAKRSYAFRETYVVGSDDIPAALVVVNAGKAGGGSPGLVGLRAALLPPTATIAKVSFQKFVIHPSLGEYPKGATETRYIIQPGTSGKVTDFPQMALQVRLTLVGGQPHVIRPILRCIPDGMVTRGEFYNTFPANKPYVDAVKAFLGELATRYGTFVDDRASDGGKGRRVDTIGSDGSLAYFGAGLGATEGTLVKVTRSTDSDGRRKSGVYQVVGVGDNGLLLYAWQHGETEGGTVRIWSRTYAPFAAQPARLSEAAWKATTRKVGSPKDYKGANRRSR